jgi:hypothetical protein
MLSAFMLSILMLNFVMLSVCMLSVLMLFALILCVYALHSTLKILSKTVERLGSECLFISAVALSLNLLLSMSANDT